MVRLLLMLLFGLTSPAHAGWHGAVWGMTPADARVALAGLPGLANGTGAPSYSSSRHRVLLTGRYSAGPHAFRADIGFDANGKLALVELLPADMAKCWALRSDLRDRYGAPHEAQGNQIFEVNRWRVPADDNVVELRIMKGGTLSCVLKYRPLSTAGTRGL